MLLPLSASSRLAHERKQTSEKSVLFNAGSAHGISLLGSQYAGEASFARFNSPKREGRIKSKASTQILLCTTNTGKLCRAYQYSSS
jgi:hypothetical protein